MMPFGRLLRVQAVVVALTVVAAIAGGLAAGSWVWAAGCGILTYLAGSAVILAMMARAFRSGGWRAPDHGWPDDNWPDGD